MLKWLGWRGRNWRQRQLMAMADLVYCTREINPNWKEIQITRDEADGVLLSVVSEKAAKEEGR